MKTKNRILSLLLAVFMLVGLLPMNIWAATPKSTEEPASISETDAAVYVEDNYGKSGGLVEVLVKIKNNPGIASAKLSISFDSALKLVDIAGGHALATLDFTPPGKSIGEDSYASPATFLWDSIIGEDTRDGNILKLTFKLPDDAVIGQAYTLDISCETGDFADQELETVDVTLLDGNILVLDYIPGDVNDDARINGLDVTLLRRFIAGGYGAVITKNAGDVNGDGMLNGTDVTLLRRYIASGYGVKLLPAYIACVHDLSATAAKASTCTEDGNIAYWHCTLCGAYYSDAEATTEILYADTVLAASGHTVVIDEAKAPTYTETGLTEGSHCSTCDTVLIAQEEIPVLDPEEYSITYSGVKSAIIPSEYRTYTGATNFYLPEIEEDGYYFDGWFTTNDATGVEMEYIQEGSTGNIKLYARWTPITYTITYKSGIKDYDIVHDNDKTYTIDSADIVLQAPKMYWMRFTGWTFVDPIDGESKLIDRIPHGSTGHIELTATWKTYINTAVPQTNARSLLTSTEDDGKFLFIYELGNIENVILDDLSVVGEGATYKLYPKFGVGQTLNITETVSINESQAQSISKMVATSVTNSASFSVAAELATEFSATLGYSATAGAEVDTGVVSANASTTLSSEFTASVETSLTSTTGTNNSESSEEAKTFTSNIEYGTALSTSTSTTMEIKDTDPNGYYALVHMGTVKVFAVVQYDMLTGDYNLSTYSILAGTTEPTLVYTRTDAELRAKTCDALEYDVMMEEIDELAKSTYYIYYQLKTQDMADSSAEFVNPNSNVFRYTGSETLSFENPSSNHYSFDGWYADAGFTTPINASWIADWYQNPTNITLYAKWVENEYNISYVLDLPEESLPSCYYPVDINHIINENPDTITPTASFDFTAPVRSEYDEFIGWYLDAAFTIPINDPTNENWALWLANWRKNPSSFTLYAKWNYAYYVKGNMMYGRWPQAQEENGVLRDIFVYDLSEYNGANGYTYIADYDSTSIMHLTDFVDIYLIGKEGCAYTINIPLSAYKEQPEFTVHLKNFSGNIDFHPHASENLAVRFDISGNNTLTANDGAVIEGFKSISITGDGTLILQGANGSPAINVDTGTIDGTIVKADYERFVYPITEFSKGTAIQFEGHTYQYFAEAVTYHEAVAKCEELGGHLVTITSKEENAVLSAIENAWIGGNDFDTEGTFVWITGEEMTYVNWASGEPNNVDGYQDCILLWGSSQIVFGLWDDNYETAKNGYICEWDYIK